MIAPRGAADFAHDNPPKSGARVSTNSSTAPINFVAVVVIERDRQRHHAPLRKPDDAAREEVEIEQAEEARMPLWPNPRPSGSCRRAYARDQSSRSRWNCIGKPAWPTTALSVRATRRRNRSKVRARSGV